MDEAIKAKSTLPQHTASPQPVFGRVPPPTRGLGSLPVGSQKRFLGDRLGETMGKTAAE